MAHKVAHVEIEFDHDEQDGDAILRAHLEVMLASMRATLIGNPHYHISGATENMQRTPVTPLFVIKRISDGAYVTDPTVRESYTRSVGKARRFATRKGAMDEVRVHETSLGRSLHFVADMAEEIADLEMEITRLRMALLPFAERALTRAGQDASISDSSAVAVTLGECRAAQRAMGS